MAAFSPRLRQGGALFDGSRGEDTLGRTLVICQKVGRHLDNGRQLENLSFRLWHLQRRRGLTDDELRTRVDAVQDAPTQLPIPTPSMATVDIRPEREVVWHSFASMFGGTAQHSVGAGSVGGSNPASEATFAPKLRLAVPPPPLGYPLAPPAPTRRRSSRISGATPDVGSDEAELVDGDVEFEPPRDDGGGRRGSRRGRAQQMPGATQLPASSSNTVSVGGAASCHNCASTVTPLWRRGPHNELLCNACGLYFRLHKKHRPKTFGPSLTAPSAPKASVMSSLPPQFPISGKLGKLADEFVPDGEADCSNCATSDTPKWRILDMEIVCKLHGKAREVAGQPSKRRRLDPPASLSQSLPASTRRSDSPAASTSRRPSDATMAVPTPPSSSAHSPPTWPVDPFARYRPAAPLSSAPPPALRRTATFEPAGAGFGAPTTPDFGWLTGAPPRTYQPPPTTTQPPASTIQRRDSASSFGQPAPSTSNVAEHAPSFYGTAETSEGHGAYAWAQPAAHSPMPMFEYGAGAPSLFGSTSQAEAAQSLFALHAAGQR